jgi:hypothetical protein
VAQQGEPPAVALPVLKVWVGIVSGVAHNEKSRPLRSGCNGGLAESATC